MSKHAKPQRGTVPWSIAGPVRTGLQAGPAYAIVEFIDAFLKDMSDRQFAALVVLLTLVIGAVQGAVENYTERAVLRQVPPKDAPLVDDKPPAA